MGYVNYYIFGGTKVALHQHFTDNTDKLSYMHGDHLGSTSLTTDDTGGQVSSVRYTPYGQERSVFGSSPTGFGFTSQRNEVSFGLRDYNARYYSPILGRNPDSIVPNPVNSQDWNRYSYGRNNPIRYNDPSGHTCIDGFTTIGCITIDVAIFIVAVDVADVIYSSYVLSNQDNYSAMD